MAQLIIEITNTELKRSAIDFIASGDVHGEVFISTVAEIAAESTALSQWTEFVSALDRLKMTVEFRLTDDTDFDADGPNDTVGESIVTVTMTVDDDALTQENFAAAWDGFYDVFAAIIAGSQAAFTALGDEAATFAARLGIVGADQTAIRRSIRRNIIMPPVGG